ncbi:cyclase family protein [Chloroflexota bacterium]
MSTSRSIYRTVYDISVLLGGEQVDVPIPGVPPFSRELIFAVDKDGFELSKLEMTSHLGTHIDAPAHFIPGGKTIDEYPAGKFILPALVVELRDKEAAKLSEVENLDINEGDALLFKTDNSRSGKCRSGTFTEDWVYVTTEVADYCVANKVSLVGIDYIAPEKPGGEITESPVHKKLLGNDILVLEAINLESVKPGKYTLFCLPLKIKGGEASPVRAILVA